ncbi:MAG: hypothetical protein U0T75_13085 [Chitinophagales bacterium]
MELTLVLIKAAAIAFVVLTKQLKAQRTETKPLGQPVPAGAPAPNGVTG